MNHNTITILLWWSELSPDEWQLEQKTTIERFEPLEIVWV